MTDPASPKPAKLLDHMREALRVRHYSYRTEQAYLDCPWKWGQTTGSGDRPRFSAFQARKVAGPSDM